MSVAYTTTFSDFRCKILCCDKIHTMLFCFHWYTKSLQFFGITINSKTLSDPYWPPPGGICYCRRLSVCLSVCNITQKVMDGFWWNFQEMSEMQWGTSGKILVAIREQFVCLLAYYSKTYKWILMKFSGKIEDGTSNEPLNFGNDLWPRRRSALSGCFSSSFLFPSFCFRQSYRYMTHMI